MKLAILGCGGIAETMARTVNGMGDEAELYAIGSRSLAKAEAFKEKYNVTKAYGSYEEMLADDEIDLVYIAVPHSHHCQWSVAALNAGRNVLCEKPFAVNEKQAREMIELAEKKNLLITEGIWTRYMPSRKIIDELVEQGTIGRLITVSANLGYRIDMNERMVKPELAGGALLDLTVYVLNFASMVWGDDIKKITASCVMTNTGVDGQDTVMIEYQDGRMANLFTTMYALTNRMGLIVGTEGFIEVENINNPQEIRVYSPDREGPVLKQCIKVPEQITGFEYEVLSCKRAIEEGRIECPEMPHSQTIQITCQMDRIREQFGIKFPFE
ncbi:MAG: Gfo/Idh/MocA family oxidoreductase [Lachnospiraceae bacterium]|nr:Gfo/Idh/MocA family oxidoreductase [Lachnospiraceae bacterium]